ncbi:MAG TPA: glycosyltransferase family 4 protein [Thioploca sp.]|nr:MAG: glycosyltransferase family 4 protein [Gammaproteobacteria bacterium]HDN26011.1 glycosyltransferase family 4 protein [Thioploca sp.]
MKLIVLHDYFESLEGGGRLSSLLAQGLSADLGYGFARAGHPFLEERGKEKGERGSVQGERRKGATEEMNFSESSPLFPAQHDLRAYSAIPLWRQFKLARAFAQRTAFLNHYDTVIYSGFYTPLAVRHHQQGRNILYCHTPPRFIYDQRDFYLKRLPWFLRPALQAFIHYLQPRYEDAIAQMDLLIANSENVRQRIQHYLSKDAVIVYPPCDTARFVWQGQGNYYLSMGRLDPLKRVDLIIQAFLKMPQKRLIVASGGEELQRLQRLANNAPHIRFTNWLDDTQLAALVGNAIATLYLPKDEDFGMSPLESMAAGKPVIGVAEGGLLETVIAEKTGILLEPPLSTAAICEAVEMMTPRRALMMRRDCEMQAQRFRVEVFLEQMRQHNCKK